MRIGRRQRSLQLFPLAAAAVMALPSCASRSPAGTETTAESTAAQAPAQQTEQATAGESTTDSTEPIEAVAPADEEILNAVRRELRVDPQVRAHGIDVAVQAGVVTFTGTVDNLRAAERAPLLAETLRGVRAVVNQLQIVDSDRPAEELAEDVRTSLLYDASIDASEIEVTAGPGGQVTIEGEVSSWQQRRLVEWTVGGINGVTEIRNALEIEVPEERTNEQIEEQIRARLRADRWIDAFMIEVDVDDGTATLTGSVGSAAERSKAFRDAFVSGVDEVDVSGLTVTFWARRPMERSPDEVRERTDTEVVEAVRDALLFDPRVPFSEVEVAANDGAVTLSGVVDSVAAQRAAASTAMNTVGVFRVHNDLVVRPTSELTDIQLRSRVNSVLAWSPIISRHDIRVVVENGRVYLYGDVDSEFERNEAGRLISTVEGATEVENMLSIREQAGDELEDWEVAQDIEYQLAWDTRVQADTVEVEVENGVVTLGGTVEDWRAYVAAIENAREGGAARVVPDMLILEGPSNLQP